MIGTLQDQRAGIDASKRQIVDPTKTLAGVFVMLDRRAKQRAYSGMTGKTKHQHFAELLMANPDAKQMLAAQLSNARRTGGLR